MTRGKARVERSGSAGLDLDDDETAIQVTADAIAMSCRYGSDDVAEKTVAAGEKLKAWIEKSTTVSDGKALRDSSESEEAASEVPQRPALAPEVQRIAFGAIGISQANYARFASSPTARIDVQAKAVQSLQASIQSVSTPKLDYLFALGLALAVSRDVSGAHDVVKRALHQAEGIDDFSHLDSLHNDAQGSQLESSEVEIRKYDRRRKTLPIWHLMAQILCAREDYSLASHCLSAALQQFNSSANILSENNMARHDRNMSSLSASAGPRISRRTLASPTSTSPFDRMEPFEKHTVLEMKMTQLSLLEVTEGPDAAVNASDQVFSLYTQMFGVQDLANIRPATKAGPAFPKSSSGTVRSIFSRHKNSSRPASGLPTANPSAMTSRPNTAPTIQVTAENGAITEPRESTDGTASRRNTLKKKTSGGVKRQDSTRSTTTAPYSGRTSVERDPRLADRSQPQTIPEGEQLDGGLTNTSSRPQDFDHIPHNIPPEKQPPPQGHTGQPPSQDVRLPVSSPEASNSHNSSYVGSDSPHPHFHKLSEYKATTSLLIKIWLFVARLYTAASSPAASTYQQALLAVDEATKLVAAIETAVATEYGASVRHFQETGWGGGKSVEELWADVCSERGKLSVAQGLPHDAMVQFERALGHSPDHAEATVGLCNILLDVYTQLVPAEKPDPDAIEIPQISTTPSTNSITQPNDIPAPTTNGTAAPATPSTPLDPLSGPAVPQRPSQSTETRALNRTAARDRAYGLLSSLTKLPLGWDDPEAWYALARAYEESGQIEKAKEALWTVVGLEDTRPLRHWRNVSPGGFVL